MTPTFTATLCNADGSEAGCGRCVRPAGHPLGEGEMHQGPGGKRDRFYLMERCPFCVELHEEGPQLAAHVLEVHGGGVVVAGAAVTDHDWHNDGTGPGCAELVGEGDASSPCLKPREAHLRSVAAPVEQLGLFGATT